MGIFRSLVSVYDESRVRISLLVSLSDCRKKSAILGVKGETPLGVATSHVGICRFDSQGDDTYVKLIWRLRSILPKEDVTQSNRGRRFPIETIVDC